MKQLSKIQSPRDVQVPPETERLIDWEITKTLYNPEKEKSVWNMISKGKALSFHEWQLLKDTEGNLKRKLIKETKNDLHSELVSTLEDTEQALKQDD